MLNNIQQVVYMMFFLFLTEENDFPFSLFMEKFFLSFSFCLPLSLPHAFPLALTLNIFKFEV